MVGQRTLNPYVGVRILRPQPEMIDGALPGGEAVAAIPQTRIATMVDWAFAPDWLTVQQAVELSGHDVDTVRWLIEDGAVDTRRDGDTWLIEKESLYEFQEALAEVLHWWG
jgi:hypothetical protein